MRLYLFLGFGLGLLLLPAAFFQEQIAEHLLGINVGCCEVSLEDAQMFAGASGLLLGPWLGMFSAATLRWREIKRLRAARFCALVGAATGGALPLSVVATAWHDPEYVHEPKGVYLIIVSASLPLAWALGLGLFAFFARPCKS